MRSGYHRAVVEKRPPWDRPSWNSAIKCGEPSNKPNTSTWGVQASCHKQRINHGLMARLPGDGPKHCYLGTNTQIQQRGRRDSRRRNWSDQPAQRKRDDSDNNYGDKVDSRRPTEGSELWHDGGSLDPEIGSYATRS